MKNQSTVQPARFYKSANKIFINDLSTVIESEIENEGMEPTTIYTYDSYILPISDRPELSDYIQLYYNTLLQFAKDEVEAERIRQLTTPSKAEQEKAEREIETINLLIELEVI